MLMLCLHNLMRALSICREVLLSYVVSGDDIKALGSLTVLSTLLQTKGQDFGIITFILLYKFDSSFIEMFSFLL